MGPEGAELWETSDHGCDIMLRHLQAARDMAHNTESFTANAYKVLQGTDITPEASDAKGLYLSQNMTSGY